MHVKDYFGIWRWKSFIPSLCRSLGLLAAYRVWLWAESKDLGFPVAPPLQTSQEEKNLIQYCNRWALEFTSFPAAIHPHTTSFFAVTTLDFRSPSNLFVLLKHYCDPTWKQQLLLLFANIFISSPAAMLSWWNRCLRGSLLFASHGDEPGGSARPEQPRDSLRVPSPAGFPNGAGRRCAKLLVSAKDCRLGATPTAPAPLFCSGQWVWDELLKTILASRAHGELLPFTVITLHTIALFSRASWLFGWN